MALSSSVVWEVRTTGDDTNGGGFNTASSGTDYSQQDNPVLTVTDAATSGAGSTTLTSATGGFTSAMVGNVCHLYGGTNLTPGWYEIVGYTDTNTVTLDRAPDDGNGGVSGATCKVGGALGSPGGLGAAFENAGVDNQTAYIKSGTYSITSATYNSSNGILRINKVVSLVGYNVTRGDDPHPISGDQPILKASIDNSTNSIMQVQKDGTVIKFITITVAVGHSWYYGFSSTSNTVLYRCRSEKMGNNFSYGSIIECVARGGSVGFVWANTYGCIAIDMSQAGFEACTSINCVADNCNPGFFSRYGYIMYACTAIHSAVGNGFESMGGYDLKCYSCYAGNNVGYGYVSGYNSSHLIHCADYNNSSGRKSGSFRLDFKAITCTQQPLVDPNNADWTLRDYRPNDVSGGGALLRGTGIAVINQTDNRDVGAVQHTDPTGGGGSGGLLVHPGMDGGMRG